MTARRRRQDRQSVPVELPPIPLPTTVCSADLLHARLLVNAELSSWLPFKVFHRVGDIDLLPIDLHFLQTSIQKLSRGSNERPSLFVFVVTGLFTDHHDGNFRRSCLRARLQFSKNSLCGITVEFASMACLNGIAQDAQCASWRHEWCCSFVLTCNHAERPLD